MLGDADNRLSCVSPHDSGMSSTVDTESQCQVVLVSELSQISTGRIEARFRTTTLHGRSMPKSWNLENNKDGKICCRCTKRKRNNSTLQENNGPSMFKRRILERLGWKVINIDYREAASHHCSPEWLGRLLEVHGPFMKHRLPITSLTCCVVLIILGKRKD